mgnify:CR=1 FL=1
MNDNAQPDTARAVAEKHEEKLLMLGPVLERLHNELLEPLVAFTFERCLQTGILPPPPEELDELDRRIIQLKIEREAVKKETDQASKKRPS